MACIEVFAAGDCLAPTAGGRMGSRGRDRSRSLVAFATWAMAKTSDNLMFYLLEWIYFGINKLENSATTRCHRLCLIVA